MSARCPHPNCKNSKITSFCVSCSRIKNFEGFSLLVGVPRLELGTSCSQSRRASRASPSRLRDRAQPVSAVASEAVHSLFPPRPNFATRHMPAVGAARLELAASCSQSRRATNCATPRQRALTRAVRPEGFEPPAFWSEARRSDPLS